MKKRGKHTKFWGMVDLRTRKEAQEFVKHIKKALNMHRYRGYIKTECGD